MGTIAVVGIGLIGGSYGLAVRERGLAEVVIGCARTQSTLDGALARGAADEVTTDVSQACARADLVLLCQPPDTVVRMMPEVAASVQPGAVVTDAASVKAPIVQAGERWLSDPGQFVGGHPMAGSEKAGIAYARADLFEGATYVLTPTARTHEAATEVVGELARAVGARVRIMEPEEHDRAVAGASHAPHAVAAALARAVIPDRSAADVHGAGLRDTTRVAASDAALWRQILLANADAVVEALGRVEGEIATLREALVSRDEAAIEGWLAMAASLRRSLGAPAGEGP